MDELINNKSAYSSWLERLSQEYQRSQIKAAVSVNREMLSFYWHLGRDITAMKADSKWGGGFYETLSRDLKDRIPSASCFSTTNLRYMERFYHLFPGGEGNLPQLGADLDQAMSSANLPKLGDEIFCLPWGISS